MNGEMLPILVMSSRKDPALVKGEPTSVAVLVGKPWLVIAVNGKLVLAIAWGDGGGRVGVRGRPPVSPVGGAKVNGEYIWPVLYGSAKLTACVNRVGVTGILFPDWLKNWAPKSPGDIGIELVPEGKMNLVSPTLLEVVIWIGSPLVTVLLGGVALPLLMVSVLAVVLLEVSTWEVASPCEVMTPGYCHTGDRISIQGQEKHYYKYYKLYIKYTGVCVCVPYMYIHNIWKQNAQSGFFCSKFKSNQEKQLHVNNMNKMKTLALCMYRIKPLLCNCILCYVNASTSILRSIYINLYTLHSVLTGYMGWCRSPGW